MFCLFVCKTAVAQFAFGGGLSYGLPFVLSKQGYYIRHSIGGDIELSYKPQRSRLYPSIDFGISQMQVLVTAENYNDLNDATGYKNATLNLNYTAGTGAQYFVFYTGVGLGGVKPQESSIEEINQSVNIQLADSGGARLCPVINLGAKCFVRISPDAPLYLGFDLRMQYLQIMQSDPEYYLHDGNKVVKANISGTYLIPSVTVSLNYIFERPGEQGSE